MIRTVEDLGAHLGAYEDTSASIARRVYKDTACGCPAGVKTGALREREVVYVVTCRLSIRGWIPLYWRTKHGKRQRVPIGHAHGPGTIDSFGVPVEEIPIGLQAALMMDAPTYMTEVELETWKSRWNHSYRVIGCSVSDEPHKEFNGQWMDGVDTEDDYLLRKTHRGGFVYLTIKAREPIIGTYFWVTGYCEGSDWEHPVHEVPLPCRPEDIDEAIEQADKDGNETWDNTHACDDCWPEGTVDCYGNEFGPDDVGGPINPECKSCKGDGAIL